jgi:hypothetical protein
MLRRLASTTEILGRIGLALTYNAVAIVRALDSDTCSAKDVAPPFVLWRTLHKDDTSCVSLKEQQLRLPRWLCQQH